MLSHHEISLQRISWGMAAVAIVTATGLALTASGSRAAQQMAAMDNATRNAGDMIKRYTLEYNRSRQAQITKELIEIISGAEAV